MKTIIAVFCSLLVSLTSFAQTPADQPTTTPPLATAPATTPQPATATPAPAILTPDPPAAIPATTKKKEPPCILKHLRIWAPLYEVIGQLATGLAVIVGLVSIFISAGSLRAARRAVAVAEQAIANQTEWQQRVTEKQIYFQIVHAEWTLAMTNWKDAQSRGAAVDAPPDLRTQLIAAGVLKAN